MTEQQIQQKIIFWLITNHHEPYKIIAANKNGVPDILCCLSSGRFLAIEVKKPGGKASPMQRYRIRRILERGGLGLITDNLEEVKEYLEKVNFSLDK